MQVHEHFENWDNYANKCSVCLHAVDENGIILWANDTELAAMGYKPQEYIGKFIGDFHVDEPVVNDILGRLTRDETVNAYPARLKAKDGSTKYVMINSNVYHEKDGKFGHTRCFTTDIGEKAWKALKQTANR
jgi:PAS domain S-box-containing protein